MAEMWPKTPGISPLATPSGCNFLGSMLQFSNSNDQLHQSVETTRCGHRIVRNDFMDLQRCQLSTKASLSIVVGFKIDEMIWQTCL